METSRPCPDLTGLPQPDPGMNWRSLNQFKNSERNEDFYITCLKYAQRLWQQGFPARAILCLDRAWAANLSGAEAVLAEWPLPYQPLVAIVQQAPPGRFLGNPRVHFQHYADRVGPPRQEQRKWRSWACWALCCRARPDLPSDPRHRVQEPSLEQIETELARHGHPGESALWRRTLDEIRFPPL